MFWTRFIELCNESGKSPNAVAAACGVKSSGTVTGWRNGSIPRAPVLHKMADYFHVTEDYLLGNVNEPYFYLDNARNLREINSYEDTSETPSPQFIRRTELLARRGISRSALSKESGISTYRLKHYFSEDTISKTDLLEEYPRLARALGVSPQYLYCLTDQENDEADTDERFRDWVMEHHEAFPAQKESPTPKDGGGLSDEDMRLIEWFRSLPPEKRKAILMLGEAPEGLDE